VNNNQQTKAAIRKLQATTKTQLTARHDTIQYDTLQQTTSGYSASTAKKAANCKL
jgi:hypothetical protein